MPVYASVDALKDLLCMNEDNERDGALTDAIEAASRWIEKETARRFYVVTPPEVRYYTACGAQSSPWNWERPGGGFSAQVIDIDDALTVTEVATDEAADGTYATVWTPIVDYALWPRNAAQQGKPYRQIRRNQALGNYFFPRFEDAVRVTGTFGYSTTAPADIRQLCLMVAEVFARPILDMTMPGMQTYKLGQEVSVTMKSEDLPPLGKQIVADYRDGVFLWSCQTRVLTKARNIIMHTLRSEATVVRKTRTGDDAGGAVESWADGTTYPCNFEPYPISPVEREDTARVKSLSYWGFVFPATADVRVTDRLKVGTRVFEVAGGGLSSAAVSLRLTALEIQ